MTKHTHQYRLALIGFGVVGQGLASVLRDRGEMLAQRFGLQLQIVAVADALKGSVYDPQGIDPAALLDAVAADGSLRRIKAPHTGWDALRTIAEAEADVVVELTYTNLQTGEPAISHVRRALDRGLHVVTTNKGPIALHYAELNALARARGVGLGVEGTVMSGTPTLRLGQELLAAAGVWGVEGILNGTTNYILTQMEAGLDYAVALQQAQANGYAEADPTGDVEGYDAAAKVVILANLLMGVPLTLGDVDRQGMTHLTARDIDEARSAGERWKLIGKVERTTDGTPVQAEVRPRRIPLAHPLAAVSGATNAITYHTDLLGDVTLVGPGAGRIETAYALVQDLLALKRGIS